jgi:hypothetical protein
VKRLALILLLAGCGETPQAGNCGNQECCPPSAPGGSSCGTVKLLCGVDPMGSCTCGTDLHWHCFGTQDLSIFTPQDLAAPHD